MELTFQGAPVMAFLLASIRLVAWLVLVPPFATRSVPTRVKITLAFALAILVVPNFTKSFEPPSTVVELIGVAAQEALVGASLGFVTYLIMAAVQAAGDLIDVFGGFSLAAAYDPLSFQMNSVFGRLYQMLATALLFTTGAHLVMIAGLLATFRKLPLGDLMDVSDLGSIVPTAFSVFLTCAVQIALPLMGVLFLADLGLALMTKVAPHLNAIGIMFPAKIGLTLIIVGMSFTILPEAVDRLKDHAIDAMMAVVT